MLFCNTRCRDIELHTLQWVFDKKSLPTASDLAIQDEEEEEHGGGNMHIPSSTDERKKNKVGISPHDGNSDIISGGQTTDRPQTSCCTLF